VLRYRYAPEVARVLAESVDGLYDWVAPLPEDLCLLSDGQPWLTSIAHERDGFVDNDSDRGPLS
jgi:hypothetical protein